MGSYYLVSVFKYQSYYHYLPLVEIRASEQYLSTHERYFKVRFCIYSGF